MHAVEKKRKIGLALQGGGSAGAFTAGALDALILDTSIEITHITGTSAGALNGYVVTQAINKYGYDLEGRSIARKRLNDTWRMLTTPYSMSPPQDLCMQFARMANPLLDMALKQGFSYTLQRNLETLLHNPNALQQGTPIHLTINAVDDDGQEKLFMGNDLNARAVLASAALPGFINPVKIGNSYYRDGACAGGSNPPYSPLWNNSDDLDAVICIMTNIPEHPVKEQLQSDLKPVDCKNTDGLILHQSFNEIAYWLRHSPIPVHVIMPPIETPWSSKDKQDISRLTMERRKQMGISVMNDFLNIHGDTLGEQSSTTVEQLKKRANRDRNPVAA